MKKYILFSFVFILSLILLGSFSAKSASAANCASGDLFSSVTGQACSATTTPAACASGDLFSTVTGQPCSGNTSTDNSVVTQFNNLFKSNFKIGLRGNSDVTALQQFLKDQGYYFGKIDGSYGRITARAVSDFKGDNNIGNAIPPTTIPAPILPITPVSIAPTPTQSTSLSQTPVINEVDGPQTLNVGQQGTWTVNASDTSGGSLSYSVFWGGEFKDYYTPSTLPTQQSATFTHTYSQAGNYTPAFAVINNSGKAAQTSLSVNVVASNVTPTPFTFPANTEPNQVLGLSASVSGSSVNLSWSAVTINSGIMSPISVYNIYRSTYPTASPVLIAKQNAISYTDSGLSPGTYYYQIRAQDVNGLIGPASSQVSAIIIASAVITPPSSPVTVLPVFNNSSSDASKIVSVGMNGASNATKATYNFVTSGGISTITELKFSVTDTNTVSSISVGNASAAVVNGVADINGLNILAPNNGSGINQDFYLSYPGVGVNGIPSGSTSHIALEYM